MSMTVEQLAAITFLSIWIIRSVLYHQDNDHAVSAVVGGFFFAFFSIIIISAFVFVAWVAIGSPTVL